MSGEVRIGTGGAVGRITLTRPEALHALTLGMCEAMIEALLAWEDDPAVRLVMIDHEGGRGFCAGGDIRALYDSVQKDGVLGRRFFHVEYQLDHLIFTYSKPVVAFMDGIVMGGGAGISLPAPWRVGTENTLFAMPECAIGLFPDVGATWHLPRLPNGAGIYLATIGTRIRAADCLALGVISHHVPAARLAELKAALIASPDDPEAVIASRATPPATDVQRHAEAIAKWGPFFANKSARYLLADLKAQDDAFATTLADVLWRDKCPMMLATTCRAMMRGARTTDFAQNLAMEYRLAMRAIFRFDFSEGVRASVIARDNYPIWQPRKLDEVREAEVDAMFEPLSSDQEWSPLPR